jgi:hypothetical protein
MLRDPSGQLFELPPVPFSPLVVGQGFSARELQEAAAERTNPIRIWQLVRFDLQPGVAWAGVHPPNQDVRQGRNLLF